MPPLVHVIVVTHNSYRELPLCLAALAGQKHPVDTITIVDCGSDTIDYLENIGQEGVVVIPIDNVGFGKANNVGFQSLAPGNDDIVVFLNPDAFLHENAIHEMLAVYEEHKDVGCVTGKLLGYDPVAEQNTGFLDSTGIFRKWYGRWYDRGHGEVDRGLYDNIEVVPAICGALMCCNMGALTLFKDEIFDSRFFLYKEDIELSLRIRRKGWKLLYAPQIIADHCRGWNEDRSRVTYEKRLYSAENEVKLYVRHPSIFMIFAVTKYLAVRLFRM
ncbi:MAG: N-acetylglucosaminyl-diphospho-decaprenol L-rhamnosyltransferase [Desulforhopalus sp.]|jgi:N-acetylglucosaminyl-diphospho-decaprenol L-rhamnosyltransferase